MSVVTPSLRAAIAVPGWAKNELWRKARAVPSLDLRFADSKSLVDATTGSNLVTFTRASSGTYVDSEGVIRTATTNLLLSSEDLTVSPWNTVGSVTVTADSSQGLPFTGASVYRVDYSVAGDSLSHSFTYLATNYTASIRVKGTAGETIRFAGQSTFEAEDYTLTGEWQHLTQAWTATAATRSFTLNTSVGATARTIYVAAPQLEQSTTVGEYIPTTSTINSAPRFDHDPTTGESLGLLVEEQRMNSFEWSNSATQGETWNNVGTILNLASGQSDPAGGTAGIRATDANSVSAGTFIQRTSLTNLTASTTVTYSVWLKPIDCPNDVITLNVFANTTTDAINAAFSVSGTAITAASTSTSGTGAASGASFEAFPNGWYRCRLTGVPSTVTMADVRARIDLGSYQRAAGTARFDWYGSQLESGAFATSYIPTSGAAATRNTDVASITGSAFSGWYRQDEGTVFVDCKVIGDNGSNQFIYSISDGALGDEIRLFKPSTNSSITNGIEDSVDGTTNNIFANANTPFDQSFKTAYAFANNYASRAANGLASEVDNSVTVPSVNQIRIGARMNGTFYSNLYLSRLTYWPQHLADSTLQQITQ